MNPSKLVASTMTFRTYPLERALEALARAGFEQVELCTVGDWVPHFDVAHATDRSIAECAAAFRRTGMRAAAVNISGEMTLEQMENGYALARELGAGVVTYCCGNPKPDIAREELLHERARFNSRLADLGDRYGVICSIEAPHKKSLAERRCEIDEYWALQDERVKCTFDMAHLVYAGESLLDAARAYAPRTAHVHLRDAVKGNSLMRYGEGDVDFAAVLAIFRQAGYKGFYSMEYPTDSDEEAVRRLAASVGYLSKFDL